MRVISLKKDLIGNIKYGLQKNYTLYIYLLKSDHQKDGFIYLVQLNDDARNSNYYYKKFEIIEIENNENNENNEIIKLQQLVYHDVTCF